VLKFGSRPIERLERRDVPAVISVGDPGTRISEAYRIRSLTDTYSGLIETPTDVDLFAVHLFRGQALNATVTDTWNQNNRQGGLWPQIRFFGPDGSPLPQPSGGYHQNRTDSFNVASGNKGVPAAGTYYMGISARSNDGYSVLTGGGTVTPAHHTTTTGTYQIAFHINGQDVVPNPAAAIANDFNGDSTSDFAVYRPGFGYWVVRNSNSGITQVVSMGDPNQGDTAAPSDYDGDGRTDFAVYRPSQGLWIVRNPSGGTTLTFMGDPSAGDIAAPGDYDGDGRTDFAVYRPSQGLWIVRNSSGGTILTFMGDPNAGDIAAPGDFDGDGRTDFAVYRPSQGLWIVRNSSGGTTLTFMGDPSAGDIAAPGDFDGDGKTDFAVYRPSQGLWIVRNSSGGTTLTFMGDPSAGDVPVNNSAGHGYRVTSFAEPAPMITNISSSVRARLNPSSSRPSSGTTTLPAAVPRPSRVSMMKTSTQSLNWVTIQGTTFH
jgi:hypothetical protein